MSSGLDRICHTNWSKCSTNDTVVRSHQFPTTRPVGDRAPDSTVGSMENVTNE